MSLPLLPEVWGIWGASQTQTEISEHAAKAPLLQYSLRASCCTLGGSGGGSIREKKYRVELRCIFFPPSNCCPFICFPSHVSGLFFFFFFLLLHPMEVALNADEIINGPTPGNHFQVISSSTELLRVFFFHLPSQKTQVVHYPTTAKQSRWKGH